MSDAVTPVEKSDTDSLSNQAEVAKVLLGCGGRQYEVEWDAEAKVTPMGSLVFFAQYLETSGLMDELCRDTPLAYRSNNAPRERDVIGTIILSILNGQTRYAHINALRGDRVGAEVLGVKRIVSEDSVRRALARGKPDAWDAWLTRQERAVYEPLLSEDYVLDIDNTVKPLYGHQEGAELGYNPKKPGRPSHNYHTYFIGALRVILGVDVRAGKQHSGGHSMPGLWKILDGLPACCLPRLLRGDVSYGNEDGMSEAEKRAILYLFKLRRTAKIKALIRELEADACTWSDAGDGWQGTERRMKLSGWSSERRCIFLRRPAQRGGSHRKMIPEKTQEEFEFVEHVESGPDYEYIVLVTNDTLPVGTMAQLYRDRADCENAFDEIKNQWGWAGFVTHDLQRCRVIARLIALVYNWWSIFARLASPEQHREAVTSRPMLLYAVGRMVNTGRKKTIRLTSTHAMSETIRQALNRIAGIMNRLRRTAEQLSKQRAWAVILSLAFVKWLQGKVLDPIVEEDQMLLRLTS